MSERRAAVLSTAIAIIALMLILGRDLEAAILFLVAALIAALPNPTHGGGA